MIQFDHFSTSPECGTTAGLGPDVSHSQQYTVVYVDRRFCLTYAGVVNNSPTTNQVAGTAMHFWYSIEVVVVVYDSTEG